MCAACVHNACNTMIWSKFRNLQHGEGIALTVKHAKEADRFARHRVLRKLHDMIAVSSVRLGIGQTRDGVCKVTEPKADASVDC